MQKILAITKSSKLEDRLADALDSPRHLARVSSWAEAHRLMSKASPAAVLIGEDLATAAHVTEIVRLNNVLTKDGKAAYLITNQPQGPAAQWPQMFDALKEVVAAPKTPRQWRDLAEMLQVHLDAAASDAADKAAKAPAKKASKSETIVVRLPQISEGSLSSISLGRICYSLSTHSATGILHLQSGKARRKFAFSDGRFVEAPGHDDAEALTSAYAWPEGKFKFEPRQSLSGAPKSLFGLMMRGLRTYRQHRQIMQDLMPRLQTYPVATQFWSQRQDRLDWPILARVMDQCSGAKTLEQIFGVMGSDVTEAFCSAVFARDCDLVVFQANASQGPIKIRYDHQSKANTSRGAQAGSKTAPSKAERATGDERLHVASELREFYESMESMTDHEIFGLWTGCGREMVKKTYYSMVKEHHPDVYGGNVSGDVRRLAQQIFVRIRQAYTSLLKVEKEQTVPPPDPVDESASPSKRRKQVDTLHAKQGQAAIDKEAIRQSNRPQRQTSPIGLGRAPSEAHPEYPEGQTSQDGQSNQTGQFNASDESKPRRRPTTSPRNKPNKRPRRRTSSLGGTGRKRRSSSSGGEGIDEASSDAEWRRERLQRLERSTSRTRRPTPISGDKKAGIPAPKNKTKPAQKAFNSGYKKFKNGTYRQALTDFQKAHQADPKNGLYMTFYAYCLFQVDPDQIKQARELLTKAIDTGNRQAMPDAHLFLGKILKVQGHPDRAHRHFKKALELNPGAREAEREIRLYEKRKGDGNKSGGLFNKLFKK